VAPTIRRAVEADLDAMVEIMFAEPGVEQVAFMPSLAGARVFTRAAWKAAGVDEFLIAEDEGVAVGFAWLSRDGVSLGQGAKAAVRAWGLLGPARLVAKGWPRQLVEISMPPGTKIVELQAHPERRGTGVGTRLLEHVIRVAGSEPLSLTTRTNNPARRLYERHGFVVTQEKTNRHFERRTGATGRILMVRPPTGSGESGE
jgi:ribosomal protein S18 acetylase RimI-like enzyme